jgi:hypothetical protein
MPLPTVEIQAFGHPSVKDGVLTQPVTLAGEVHGFSAPVAAWRKFAWQILADTEVKRPRRPVAVVREPVAKPNGRLL